MREFPRDATWDRGFKSRVPFNPEKLLRLAKPSESNYTPPLSRRVEEDRSFGSMPRRNSDFDKPYMVEPKRGIETQRYHSN